MPRPRLNTVHRCSVMNHTLLNATARNVTKRVVNISVVKVASRTSRAIVFHNETFGVLGLQHDVEAPLWGVLTGIVIACACCMCAMISYTSYTRHTSTQPAYENLPLIMIRHGRR